MFFFMRHWTFPTDEIYLATNSSCNSMTEDCIQDPNNATVTCPCKVGYEKNNTQCIGMPETEQDVFLRMIELLHSPNYLDINECISNLSLCDPTSSVCQNTIGSYVCVCLPGYQVCSSIYSCLGCNQSAELAY